MVRLTIRCTTGLPIGQRGLLGQVPGVVVGDQGGNPGGGVEQLGDAAVGAPDEPPPVVSGEPGCVAGAGPYGAAVRYCDNLNFRHSLAKHDNLGKAAQHHTASIECEHRKLSGAC